MENNIILHDYVLLLGNKSKTYVTPQFHPQKVILLDYATKKVMSYGWGGGRGGLGHVIFNLHLGVGHSVLCQMEGVGHVFSNHHILKCSGPPPCTFWPVPNDNRMFFRGIVLALSL